MKTNYQPNVQLQELACSSTLLGPVSFKVVISVVLGEQLAPPFVGAGLVQLRLLVVFPLHWPSGQLHEDQLDQVVHPPSKEMHAKPCEIIAIA